MRKYVIERIIPAIGMAERAELRAAAKRSNAALEQLGLDILWIESYVADDKTFCVYLPRTNAGDDPAGSAETIETKNPVWRHPAETQGA